MENELKRDNSVVVWWGTRIECISALCRRLREKYYDEDGFESAMERLEYHEKSSMMIGPGERIRHSAGLLLRRHALPAADAIQLAAALAWSEENPQGQGFVCLDAKLRDAARKEGFEVLPKKQRTE